jgi:hypothetical protein
MATNVPIESKYYLKTVHAEIDLFDRRLAHLLKYDVFETEAARAAAARKESELPRSFRPDGLPAPVEARVEEPVAAVSAAGENRSARRQGSPYAGTSLDWEKSVQSYMQAKKA